MSENKPNAQPPSQVSATDADDGVDVSLIRWMLSLSAPERLAVLQAQANSLAKLRNAYSGR